MLPQVFLERPVAHRALHDIARGLPENSRAACLAAIDGGYGIEIDLQLSSDGVPMVFHDYDLDRLTDQSGPISARSAADLGQIALKHGDEGIPTLAEILDLVAGRAPLLIEIKDQSRSLSEVNGTLEAATAEALVGYDGPVALMSFNPHSMAQMARLAPEVPRGLTTCGFPPEHFAGLAPDRLQHLREIRDYAPVGACFVSHHAADLENPAVRALWSDGHPVLCWTITSPEAEAEARRLSDNVTFEGYAAKIDA